VRQEPARFDGESKSTRRLLTPRSEDRPFRQAIEGIVDLGFVLVISRASGETGFRIIQRP
jgi:hypothetical protein